MKSDWQLQPGWGWGQGVVRPQAQGGQASLGTGARAVARMPRAVRVLGTPWDTPARADPAPGPPCPQEAHPGDPLTAAGVGRVQGVVWGAVKARLAALTVDAGGVMLGGEDRATG